VDSILDTISAACSQDYPQNRYRVFVLDDAADVALAGAITELQALGAKDLRLVVRAKDPTKRDYKAGNLNNGLAYSAGLWIFDCDSLVAGLDADMVPDAAWLKSIVPYLVANPRMGLACPPQVCVACALGVFDQMIIRGR
jgi:cellulose synthase/poly-beta-1,6-N-acetylglucosamine synthase-like glycosyltransferase